MFRVYWGKIVLLLALTALIGFTVSCAVMNALIGGQVDSYEYSAQTINQLRQQLKDCRANPQCPEKKKKELIEKLEQANKQLKGKIKTDAKKAVKKTKSAIEDMGD